MHSTLHVALSLYSNMVDRREKMREKIYFSITFFSFFSIFSLLFIFKVYLRLFSTLILSFPHFLSLSSVCRPIFFAPQFAKHSDRSWIWCVMRFSSHIKFDTYSKKKIVFFSSFVTCFLCLCVSTVQHNVVKISQFIPLNGELFPIDELQHAASSFDIMNGISY